MNPTKLNKTIEIWLWLGMAMVIIQILLGGITRLTGSGLSITRWDIVTGVVYPVGTQAWEHEFELYKNTPQFHKINRDFTLQDFKFIYFWEYFHRLWARSMGIVFLLPFLWFLWKKKLDRSLILDLVVLVFLAAFVASLGWIMVASGLNDKPWVNAYKLSFHLIAAVCTLAFLLYIILKRKVYSIQIHDISKICHLFLLTMIGLTTAQLVLGGVVAGMKAAIVAPTWPTINGKMVPEHVFDISSYGNYLFVDYDRAPTGPIIVQFWHRTLAYLIFITSCLASYIWLKKLGSLSRPFVLVMMGVLLLQISLGICTLLNSIGNVSVFFGVVHQGVGILFFLYLLFLHWGPFKLKI